MSPFADVGGGGGGGGLHFRNPPDMFIEATLAAARTARDTYFGATANAADLAELAGDRTLAIILGTTVSTSRDFQTYIGNPGDAYSAANWVARTDAVQGNPGTDGLTALGGTINTPSIRYTATGWQAVNVTTDSYLAFTRTNTYADIAAVALAAGLDGSATVDLPTLGAVWRVGARYTSARKEDRLDAVWPMGAAGPFAWIILPTFHDWLKDFTLTVYTATGYNQTLVQQTFRGLAWTVPMWSILIDGVPFQVAYYQVDLTISRPATSDPLNPDAYGFSIGPNFTAPPDPGRTVSQVITP